MRCVERCWPSAAQRKVPCGRDDEERLSADIVELAARQCGRYGYRKIAEGLRRAGWLINDKRVGRIWRRERKEVHQEATQTRTALADGRIVIPHVSKVYLDFVEDRTRRFRMLKKKGRTHECLAIRVACELKAIDVIDVLSDLSILRGVPGHIRSDDGPEFIAKAVQDGSRRSGPRPPTSLQAARGRSAM